MNEKNKKNQSNDNDIETDYSNNYEDKQKNENSFEGENSDKELKNEYPSSESNSDDSTNDETKLEQAIKELEILRDEKLRLLAEMENLRKRSERDKTDSIKYGSANLARDILSPNDNLSRALNAIPQEEKRSESINNLIEGLKMVQKELVSILEKHGVKKIEALNSKFDHNLHQAMLEVESDKQEAGIVIQEIQSGYTMHDRLLRPSMVGVSKMTENKKKK